LSQVGQLELDVVDAVTTRRNFGKSNTLAIVWVGVAGVPLFGTRHWLKSSVMIEMRASFSAGTLAGARNRARDRPPP
jgi:hypothetical protein